MSLIIGSKYTDEINELRQLGYDVITFSPLENLDSEISSHADINLFRWCDGTLFINESIKDEIGEAVAPYRRVSVKDVFSPYPNDVKLNAALIGNNLMCNTKYVAKEILQYAEKNNIRIIHINQGYSKCSVCIVNNNSVITADDSIACLLKNYQIDVLKITEGNICLSKDHYGFIGGSSGRLNDNEIYFSGDLSSHPDYDRIIEFLDKYHVKPIFNKNRKLNDFGGFVKI